MASITVGDLSVSADDNGFRFALPTPDGAVEIELEARDAATIERFLAEQRSGDSRTGFRVPVHALQQQLPEALHVSLVYQTRIFDAAIVDLSLTGMLVRVADLDATKRSNLQVRLILEDHLARIDAQVVRVDGDLVALHFSASMSGGELDPPVQLGPIFSRLEQIYLSNRSGG